ncbi:hypothetical protein PG993_015253 [Apiospora rasikravindrae]|uniref:NACHT domain-containing protein n=1 Tax=Apiospora rasikravindrae TaxID=990691 RepID=A0ABR1RQ25_9PEZI
MDPLSALAIAAAVVQFAEVGGKLMMKKWRKYKEQREPEPPNDGSRWLREAEIEDALEQMTLLTRTIRESTDNAVSHVTPTAAEAQLLQLCHQCEETTGYFREVLAAAKQRSYQVTTHKTELERLWTEDTTEMRQRDLHVLQRSVTGIILLCLWENSKKTKKWEAEFGKKLNDVFSLLKRLEASTDGSTRPAVGADKLYWLLSSVDNNGPGGNARQNLSRGSDDGSSRNKPTPDLAYFFSHFVASDTTKIGDAFKETLSRESMNLEQIYQELTGRLWRRDWQPEEHPVTEAETRSISEPDVAEDLLELMTNGLCFETFTGRQEAIPHRFQSTYHWIFDRQPKKAPEGPPLWHSFPDWLEGTSDPVYWITGKPGSGKSTMMKYIVESPETRDYLERWSGPLPILVVSYYAWIAGHSLQKSWAGLKRTMLHQAVAKQPELISRVCPRRWALSQTLPYNRRFPNWESWELEESFNLLLASCGQTFKLAVFIDGLDEFDIDPKEVVHLIEGIASASTESLKICVASRPWTQFDDAFSDVPMLQMHQLTKEDTIAFVAGQLDRNQGFREILDVYPTQVRELKREIVAKARGVFLWVSVVVQSLLISFSEGESLYDLQATLEMLPSDISSLYDVIWARIEERNRRDGSWMIQVLVAAQGPLDCLTMWLADESRSTRADLEKVPVNFRDSAAVLLKRKLSARTRGILEIADASREYVDFSHRTARDWVQQPQVWDKIRASYGKDFDPDLVLFEAETLVLSIPHAPRGARWAGMKKALWYASHSGEREMDNARLVQLMDFFDESIQEDYVKAMWPSLGAGATGKQHWSMSQNRSLIHNGLLGLAAQFSILPYVQTKTAYGRNLPCRKPTQDYTSLLDCAVFGYEFFTGYDVTESLHLPPISVERRFATVRFLVDAGSAPGPKFDVYLAQERERCGADNLVLLHYYDEVCAYIKAKTSVRRQAKGVLGWVSSIVRSPRSG